MTPPNTPRKDEVRHNWLPISECLSQQEVLVCNDCLLGWHAVAIQCALGEWWYADCRVRLKYEPTHFQPLPSIHPIALCRGKASEQ